MPGQEAVEALGVRLALGLLCQSQPRRHRHMVPPAQLLERRQLWGREAGRGSVQGVAGAVGGAPPCPAPPPGAHSQVDRRPAGHRSSVRRLGGPAMGGGEGWLPIHRNPTLWSGEERSPSAGGKDNSMPPLAELLPLNGETRCDHHPPRGAVLKTSDNCVLMWTGWPERACRDAQCYHLVVD